MTTGNDDLAIALDTLNEAPQWVLERVVLTLQRAAKQESDAADDLADAEMHELADMAATVKDAYLLAAFAISCVDELDVAEGDE